MAALVSALLYIAAYPGHLSGMLAFVCLVPWLAALVGRSIAFRLWYSLVFSAAAYLVFFSAIFYGAAITVFPEPAMAATLSTLCLLGYMLPFLLFGAVHGRFEALSLRNAVILAAWLTLGIQLNPVLFDFYPVAFLYDQPLLLQVLDLSGPSLLLWLIVLANLLLRNLLVLAWRHRRDGASRASLSSHAAALLLLVAVTLGYGYGRLAQESPSTAGAIRVATVQANLGSPLSQLAVVRDSRRRPGYSYVELTREAIATHGPVDLVIWPENGVALDCEHAVVRARTAGLARDLGTPILFQCSQCAANDAQPCRNQSRYLDSKGELRAVYDKQHLIPFFEWLPTAGWATGLAAHLRTELLFEKGSNSRLFQLGKVVILPAICFDAHDPHLLRRGAALGAELLVIQSNNRIFRDSRMGLYDLAINVVDSTSLGLPMVKVSNSGFGGFVTADGRILPGSISPLLARHIAVHDLPLDGRVTPYRRFGDWFSWVLVVLGFAGLMAGYRQGRATHPKAKAGSGQDHTAAG